MSQLTTPERVPTRYREAILSALPELTDSRFTVAGRGWHSLAVDVDGRLIFKFPEGEEAETALVREARLLTAARPFISIAVPDMVIHGGPPLFSQHAKLPGSTILADDYAKLNEAARQLLANDLARFLVDVHAIDPNIMLEAGAEPVGWWDIEPATLAPVWDALPQPVLDEARATIDAYRSLGPDPLGEVYGFFDAHGWNLAFDHETQRLRGVFDFADSGFGPPHREFVQVSLISPDLAARTMRAYMAMTGRQIDPGRVFLLTAAQRLSELAGALETGEHVQMGLRNVIDWFQQQDVRRRSE